MIVDPPTFLCGSDPPRLLAGGSAASRDARGDEDARGFQDGRSATSMRAVVLGKRAVKTSQSCARGIAHASRRAEVRQRSGQLVLDGRLPTGGYESDSPRREVTGPTGIDAALKHTPRRAALPLLSARVGGTPGYPSIGAVRACSGARPAFPRASHRRLRLRSLHRRRAASEAYRARYAFARRRSGRAPLSSVASTFPSKLRVSSESSASPSERLLAAALLTAEVFVRAHEICERSSFLRRAASS